MMRRKRRSIGIGLSLLGAVVFLVAGCTVDSEGTGLNVAAGAGGADWDGSSGTGGTSSQGGAAGTGGTGGLDASPDSTGGTSGTGGTAGTGAGGTAGTGTGGTGAGGTSGGSGVGGTGGTVDPGPEDCLDGLDNDNDGAVDCEDTECQVQGYACAPPVPVLDGWSGYFRLDQQNASDPQPAKNPCPDPSVTAERYVRDPGGPAQCEACSCGPLGGAACKPPPIECAYGDSSCSGATARPEFESGCANMPTGSMGGSHRVSCRLTGTSTVGNPGSCTPSAAPDFTNKLLYNLVVDACPFYFGSTNGCTDGDVCAEPGGGDYDGALCVQKPGDIAECPADFPTRLLVFKGATEGRSCSDCGCAPDIASITCAGGSYKVWDDNGCNGCAICAAETYVDSTNCKDLTDWADNSRISIRAQTPPALGGACNPTGGTPVGAVLTDSPVTFCCL